MRKDVKIGALLLAMCLVLSFAGCSATKKMVEKVEMNSIDEFIAETGKYVPGVFDESGYESEFWDIRFDLGGNFVASDVNALDEATEGLRESSISGGLASLEEEGVSEELKTKWKDSVYANYEMAANYVQDGYVAGNINLAVMSVYGIDEYTDEEVSELVTGGVIDSDPSAQKGSEVIAGNKYETVTLTTNNGNADVVTKMFVRTEGSFVLLMTCVYVDGYDDVYDNIIGNFEEY